MTPGPSVESGPNLTTRGRKLGRDDRWPMRNDSIRRQAQDAGWPFPVRPPYDDTGERMRAWTRLYRRLRWALGNETDWSSNLRPCAKLSRLRLAAKQRGLEATLTRAEYEALLASNRCAYCGAPPPESGHGVDRMDARKGYTSDNVVLACDACNRIKADIFSFEQMLEIGVLLRRWRAEGRWTDPRRKDARRWGGRPVIGNLRQEIEDWNRLHAGQTQSHRVLMYVRPSEGAGEVGQKYAARRSMTDGPSVPTTRSSSLHAECTSGLSRLALAGASVASESLTFLRQMGHWPLWARRAWARSEPSGAAVRRRRRLQALKRLTQSWCCRDSRLPAG